MSRLLEQGASWSGHERNVVYLNRGDGSFSDISAASGGDYDDDGRVVVAVDLDGDGDEDLLLRNRTSPSLRAVRNDAGNGMNWIAVRPRGASTNRFGIGATVTVEAGGSKIRRTLRAGEGYLAQSGSWLTFGLGAHKTVDRLTVQFPRGPVVEYKVEAVNKRYDLIEGAGLRALPQTPSMPLRDGALARAESPRHGRVLLRVPMSTPPTLRDALKPVIGISDRPVLINLYSPTCVPCLKEWDAWAKDVELFKESRVHVVALLASEGEMAATDRAARWKEIVREAATSGVFHHIEADESIQKVLGVLLQHITGKARDSLPLPTSILLGPRGIEWISMEPVPASVVIADALRFVVNTVHPAERSLEPGRWYFQAQRNWLSLSTALREEGLHSDALWAQSRGQR